MRETMRIASDSARPNREAMATEAAPTAGRTANRAHGKVEYRSAGAVRRRPVLSRRWVTTSPAAAGGVRTGRRPPDHRGQPRAAAGDDRRADRQLR